jgi:splicing suppressor protein 51
MSFMIWSCTSNLIQLDARMPWLSGAASMLQLALLKGPGRIASLNGRMDR